MSEPRKTPSGRLNTTTTTSAMVNDDENSNIDNGDISDINENTESSNQQASPATAYTTRPNREVPDEEASDSRPAKPPKRTVSSSKRSGKKKGKSRHREKTLSEKANVQNAGQTDPSPQSDSRAKMSIEKTRVTMRTGKSPRVGSASHDRNNKGVSENEPNVKNAGQTDPSPQSGSRAERSIEKTRVTTRTANSNYVGNASQDRNNKGVSKNEKSDDGDDGDYSVSTAPAPPSLRVHEHHSLRPGAYRMYTGGVARYVNAESDDIDNYSINVDDPGVDDAVALESRIFQDEPVLSPPLYRPTTSIGYTVFDQRTDEYEGSRNPSVQENTELHRDRYRSTDHSTEGVISRAPTAMTYTSRFTTAVEEDSSFENDDTDGFVFFSKRNILIMVCFGVVFLIILASIGATYAIKETNDDQSPSSPPSKLPTIASFTKTLPDYTKESLKIESSPQRKAINWMTTYDDIDSYPLFRRLQRFALISLYFSTTIKDPSHEILTWLAGLDECSWFPSKCDDDFMYTSLSLQSSYSLRGTIVPELALLTSLESLLIDQNALGGIIPTEIAQMTALKQIRINNNLFRGTIPTEFGKLPKLEDIDLSNNLLSGSIPTEIGSWNKVQTLMLSNNTLAGTIPTEIGQMTQLVSISLSSNKLEGKLPLTVGRLKRMERFNAEKNFLKGGFVSKFEKLGPTLKYLQLRSNNFSGTLPSTIGLLTNLVELDISNNSLKGSLPTEIGLLASLTRLQLHSNRFDDQIPTELGMLPNAESMALHHNLFTGSVPFDICELTTLTKEELTVDCSELFCMCCSCSPRKLP